MKFQASIKRRLVFAVKTRPETVWLTGSQTPEKGIRWTFN